MSCLKYQITGIIPVIPDLHVFFCIITAGVPMHEQMSWLKGHFCFLVCLLPQ